MVLNTQYLARHKISASRDSLVAPCRSAHLGGNLLRAVSRTPDTPGTREGRDDEYGKLHASGLHSTGRILLNLWRLIRGEVWDACVRMGIAAARTAQVSNWSHCLQTLHSILGDKSHTTQYA
jgi:hypothetical protein